MISSKKLSSIRKSLGFNNTSGTRSSNLWDEFTHNKIVLWILAIISFFNIFGYIESNNLVISVVFVLVGIIMSMVTDNMTIILVTTLIFSNFLAALTKDSVEYTKHKKVREKFTNSTPCTAISNRTECPLDNTKYAYWYLPDELELNNCRATKNNILRDNDDEIDFLIANNNNVNIIEGLENRKKKKNKNKYATGGTGIVGPYKFKDKQEGAKIDTNSTIKSAYSNLDKLLGSKAMQQMSKDTHDLAAQQADLISSIRNMEPVLEQARKITENIDINKMTSAIEGFTRIFKS